MGETVAQHILNSASHAGVWLDSRVKYVTHVERVN